MRRLARRPPRTLCGGRLPRGPLFRRGPRDQTSGAIRAARTVELTRNERQNDRHSTPPAPAEKKSAARNARWSPPSNASSTGSSPSRHRQRAHARPNGGRSPTSSARRSSARAAPAAARMLPGRAGAMPAPRAAFARCRPPRRPVAAPPAPPASRKQNAQPGMSRIRRGELCGYAGRRCVTSGKPAGSRTTRRRH